MESATGFLWSIYEYLAKYGLNLISAILIFFIGRWAAKVATSITEKVMIKSKVEPTLISFAKNLLYIALMAFIVIAVLNRLGIQTASFVAVLGAAGLAIGLALQGSLSNFSAGVLLVLFQPFKVGDEIETAGSTGIVKEIQIFTTIIEMADGKLAVIPNSKVTADKIIVSPRTK
ncbi:mechanosensitive ion channel family protein, partial [Desulforegula conservatrix]|uniref:mechanosensitive ion channel family protein n=1 Tax=Desulforegula conservatrix TaxID=153026 RepID=UPI0004154ED8